MEVPPGAVPSLLEQLSIGIKFDPNCQRERNLRTGEGDKLEKKTGDSGVIGSV